MAREKAELHPLELGNKALPIIMGLVSFLGIFSLFLGIGISQGARLAQLERVRALLEASTVRVGIESMLNERISLERGIVAFVSSNPRLDAATFASYAEVIRGTDTVIGGLALLQGTTVKFVHPYDENKAVIGVDLSQIPDQRESILLAMSTRDPVIVGPVKMVQGGTSIISRMSIFIAGSDGPVYWGQASVALNRDEILKQAGALNHANLTFMLRSDMESSPDVIFGDLSILEQSPILLNVSLPGITWTLAALPHSGWRQTGMPSVGLSVIGLAVGAFAGFAIFSVLRTRSTLKRMAYHDQLTELPNRSLFWDRLQMETNRAERDGTSICVCMLDLNGFKAINDSYGHEAGDRLLAEVAARMQKTIRKSDTVARLGGDEFAIIAPIDKPNSLAEVRSRIADCFTLPFDLGVVKKHMEASVGHALFPQDGIDIEALLACADKRMYKEKSKGASNASGTS